MFVGLWPIFIFLQDRANFSQTDLLNHTAELSGFLLCLRFIFFKPHRWFLALLVVYFLVLSVTRRRPLPLGQVLCRHQMMS